MINHILKDHYIGPCLIIRSTQMQFFLIFVSILAFNLPSQLLAQAPHTIDQKKTIHIINKIDSLRSKIQSLEQQIDTSDHNDLNKDYSLFKKDVDDLMEILEKVETKSLVDTISLGAELRTRMDWFDFQGHDYKPFTEIQSSDDLHERVNMLASNRLRLNFFANMDQIVQFRARVNMYKNWIDYDTPEYPDINFLNPSRIPTDVKLKVERVYVDYFFHLTDSIPAAFSFGRLPATDSLPTDLRNNTPRKSTYPALAYDSESDGLALSFDLEKITHISHAAFRLCYFYRVDDNEQYISNMKVSDKKGIFRVDPETMDSITIIAGQLEGAIPAFWHETNVYINYLYIPRTSVVDLRYDEQTYPFYYDNKRVIYVDKPTSLGQLGKITFFIESKTDYFDWFAGISYMKTKAKGALKLMFNPEPLGFSAQPVLARDAYDHYVNSFKHNAQIVEYLQALKEAPTPIGLLNNDGTSDREGVGYHVGLRTTIPIIQSKLGIEYNHGSRYWAGFSFASEDRLQKLNVRGKVWDIYYIHDINNQFFIRAGYTYSEQNYDQGLSFYYGQPLAIDHQITNTYLLFDAKF